MTPMHAIKRCPAGVFAAVGWLAVVAAFNFGVAAMYAGNATTPTQATSACAAVVLVFLAGSALCLKGGPSRVLGGVCLLFFGMCAAAFAVNAVAGAIATA